MGSAPKRTEKVRAPEPILVSRAHTFFPILDFMIKIGAPVDRLLERCKLPFQIYEDPENYIPTMNYWKFVSLTEKKEGIEDLGLRIGHDHISEMLGLPLVAGVYAAPTLLAGIETTSRLVRGIYSGMRLVLARAENDTVKLILRKSFDLEVPGFAQTEWLGFASLIAIVQLFAGRTWQPNVISLRSTRVIPPLAGAFYPDVHIMRSQPTTYISFPKKLLSLGPSGYGAEVVTELRSKTSDSTPGGPPTDFASSLQLLLAAYIADGYPSLEMMAEISGMRQRTFQRHLAEDGLDYSWLVERTRFDVATRMLMRTEASSLDIAFATGYEDPSHFARAFRRLAGCSPKEYRRRHVIQG